MAVHNEWVLCESSNVWGYRWVEGDSHPLQIRFKDKKRPDVPRGYRYAAPRDVYDGLYSTTGSKGAYVNQHVKKPGYDCLPLD